MSAMEPLLVLYDREEEYTIHMADFLREHKELPWKIRAYTKLDNLIEIESGEQPDILIVSETSFEQKLRELSPKELIILNETGLLCEDDFPNVDKYQAAEDVLREIITLYKSIADERPEEFVSMMKTKFIGVYSPVRRSLQSTFAITMGELLAEKYRTLYLSFEHFCGVADIIPGAKESDLSDLIYFLNADNEKFKLHFQSIVQQRENLMFVPPMRAGQNLLTVSPQEWMNFIRRINECGMFDFVIMDLTENIQGLPEILRNCMKVYTVVKADEPARTKILQYENMLNMCEYGDVIEKTVKFSFPHFQNLPSSLDQYTKGDLADYVRIKLKELCPLGES